MLESGTLSRDRTHCGVVVGTAYKDCLRSRIFYYVPHLLGA